jgi:hypothetical protein
MKWLWCALATIITLTPCVVIKPNYEGMVTRFGTVHHKEAGLRVVIPYIDSVEPIYSGFDTDFVSGATCVCQDNIVVTFPKVYIDNQMNCGNSSECYIDLYKTYFISDSKVKAKSADKTVPEDGTIFKHLPEALSIACSKVRAGKLYKNWHILYPDILEILRKKVPSGITIHAVRTDRPKIPNVEWRTSIVGTVSSWLYTRIISS